MESALIYVKIMTQTMTVTVYTATSPQPVPSRIAPLVDLPNLVQVPTLSLYWETKPSCLKDLMPPPITIKMTSPMMTSYQHMTVTNFYNIIPMTH